MHATHTTTCSSNAVVSSHTEAAVNGVMVFGSSWKCKWMLLCFQLIVLRNFGHGSLFMAITAGEVWFINASLIAAAPIAAHASSAVWAAGLRIRRRQNMMFVVVCFVICHPRSACPQSSLCSLWSGKAVWPFALDRHQFKEAALWRLTKHESSLQLIGQTSHCAVLALDFIPWNSQRLSYFSYSS